MPKRFFSQDVLYLKLYLLFILVHKNQKAIYLSQILVHAFTLDMKIVKNKFQKQMFQFNKIVIIMPQIYF